MNIFNLNSGLANGVGALQLTILLAITVWSLLWKGLALWHSARRGQHVWFIVLLLVNTVGILEIIYLFAFLKLKLSDLFKKK